MPAEMQTQHKHTKQPITGFQALILGYVLG